MTGICPDCGVAPLSRRAKRCNPCARADIGRRLKGRPHHGQGHKGPKSSPPPDGFAKVASGVAIKDLMERYGRSRNTIIRWKNETGAAACLEGRRPTKAPMPADFAKVAPTMSLVALSQHYGCSQQRIRRLLTEAGISAKPYRDPKAAHRLVQTRPMGMIVSIIHDNRDHSQAGRAADYLRRYSPILRCDEAGQYAENGTHWRRGSAVLCASEVIERAVFKGWKADEWRQVA